MARQKTVTNDVLIQGVNVNLDADDLRKVKSIKGLQKLKIFEHLDDSLKEGAEKELAIKLGIEQVETVLGDTQS